MVSTDSQWGDYPILESTLEYKEVFDNISACMFVVDVTSDDRFRFVGFNRAEETAVGFSSTQVAGRYVEDVFEGELAHQLIASYRRAVTSGKPIHFDSDLDLPIGKRSFQTNLIPLTDTGGRIHRIVGACIDITEFKKAKEAASARQRMESLGLLAGGVAHDFGNLVHGVLLETETAKANLPENSPGWESISKIRGLALQAGEIVRVLMAYAGQESPALAPLDSSSLIAETLDTLRGSLRSNTILRTNLPADLPPVRGNPAQIRQVIMNLVANALDALAGQPGAISIDVSLVLSGPENTGTPPAQSHRANIRLEVRDSGCGMSEEVQARIFDPFYSTKGRGRGLGLASVLGIIHAHGGTIEVTSTPGQGSRFVVMLPAMLGAGVVRDDSSDFAGNAEGRGPVTVLLVEDEDLLRRTLSKVLRAKGLRVIEAADGTTACSVFQANPSLFDVVLLDMTLPGMPGQMVLSEIRRIRPLTNVILTTAYTEELVLGGIQQGPTLRFLRKPYEAKKLYQLIDSITLNQPAWH